MTWEEFEQLRESKRAEARRQLELDNDERKATLRSLNSGETVLTRSMTLKNYCPLNESTESAKRQVAAYMERIPVRDGTGLYLCGGTGAGKTHLACSILNGALTKRIDVIFTNAADMYRFIRSAFDKNSALTETEAIERFIDIPLLIIDDLGCERPTEWNIQTLHEIIDGRYIRQLPTIVTSNYPPKELVAYYARESEPNAKRIMSRLLERNPRVAIEAPDYRKAGLQ